MNEIMDSNQFPVNKVGNYAKSRKSKAAMFLQKTDYGLNCLNKFTKKCFRFLILNKLMGKNYLKAIKKVLITFRILENSKICR